MASSSPPPPASAPSTSKAAESLRSLRCAGDSTSTSTDTARAIPGSWRDTLASTWGYPVAATPAAPAGSLALPAPRSKQLRGGIPFFNSEDPDDESEQRRAESTAVLAIVDASLEGGLVENKSEEQLERERRLDKLCAGIMYKVSRGIQLACRGVGDGWDSPERCNLAERFIGKGFNAEHKPVRRAVQFSLSAPTEPVSISLMIPTATLHPSSSLIPAFPLSPLRTRLQTRTHDRLLHRPRTPLHF